MFTEGISRRSFINKTSGIAAVLSTNYPFYEPLNISNENLPEFDSKHFMESFRIAAISTRSEEGNPKENIKHMEAWISKASEKDPALVCFPELNISGYVYGRKIWEAAEPIPGPSTSKMEALAKRYNMTIAAGIAEIDNGVVYNSYVIVGSEGYLGKSRKMHIAIPEVGSWRGGGVAPVIDIGIAKIGVNICFSNWLPESARLVALQGAEIILAPFYWGAGEVNPHDYLTRNRKLKDYCSRTLPSRAMDNGVFLIFINDCGTGASTPNGFEPVCLIYSPQGKLIAESPDSAEGEVMVIADLDRNILADRRSQGHFHPRFRRPELYKILAKGDVGRQESF